MGEVNGYCPEGLAEMPEKEGVRTWQREASGTGRGRARLLAQVEDEAVDRSDVVDVGEDGDVLPDAETTHIAFW